MSWFERALGFHEEDLSMNMFQYGSLNTPKEIFKIGKLAVPSVQELRAKVRKLPLENFKKTILAEKLGDVGNFHKSPENVGALFQVASQFNLLEMTSPDVTPEGGITRYEHDRTQGPICAMACPAGTLYRNYKTRINTLRDIEILLPNKYWTMRNGYAMFEEYQLDSLNDIIDDYGHDIIDNLRVGIQWDTEVIPSKDKYLVSQIYCSALPVIYHDIHKDKFDKFARLILRGTYEATFLSAVLNKESNKVFLTLVGAGAFGNKKELVLDAIKYCLKQYDNYGLEVTFITYGNEYDRDIQNIIKEFND